MNKKNKSWYTHLWVGIISVVMIVTGGGMFNKQVNESLGLFLMFLFLGGAGLLSKYLLEKMVRKYTPEMIILIWLICMIFFSLFGFLISTKIF